MKCPVCVKKKMKSCVYVGGSTSTLMYEQPYYDEEGNYHHNDPNTHTTSYSCSNGHRWTESSCRGENRVNVTKDTEEKPKMTKVEDLGDITFKGSD